MPKQVDHAERRHQLADALWTIAERDGFAAATVRNVAAEAGVSVGMVQHYFSTKDEMLLFALTSVGEELGARVVAKIGALPEPRDPYEVVWIVLSDRLPLHPRSKVHAQALITWLSHGADDPELARYLSEGTHRIRDYLADQLRAAQVADRTDPVLTADGLLALTDGLTSHVLQGLHTPESAKAVLTEALRHVFDRR